MKLKTLFKAQFANILHTLRDVPSDRIIDDQDKDPMLYDRFIRVIKDAQLAHSNDKINNIEVESDNYIGMEFTMARGGKGMPMHATVR